MSNRELIIAKDKGAVPSAAALSKDAIGVNVADRKIFVKHDEEVVTVVAPVGYKAVSGGGTLDAEEWSFIADSKTYTLPMIEELDAIKIRVTNGIPIIAAPTGTSIKYNDNLTSTVRLKKNTLIEFFLSEGVWNIVYLSSNMADSEESLPKVFKIDTDELHAAIVAKSGDTCIRTDLKTTYTRNSVPTGTIAQLWEENLTPDQVITAEDVGLDLLTNAELSDALVEGDEPTYASTKAISIVNQRVDDVLFTVEGKAESTELAEHVANDINPHGVTPTQLGLGHVKENTIYLMEQLPSLATKAELSELDAAMLIHLQGDNPHNITAATVDLEHVGNYPMSDSITLDSAEMYATSRAAFLLNNKILSTDTATRNRIEEVRTELLGGLSPAVVDSLNEVTALIEDNDEDIGELVAMLGNKVETSVTDGITAQVTDMETSIAELYSLNTSTTKGKVTLSDSVNFESSIISASSTAVKTANDNALLALGKAEEALGHVVEGTYTSTRDSWVRLAVGSGRVDGTLTVVDGTTGSMSALKAVVGVTNGGSSYVNVLSYVTVDAGSASLRNVRIVALDDDLVFGEKALEIFHNSITPTNSFRIESAATTSWTAITPVMDAANTQVLTDIEVAKGSMGSSGVVLSEGSPVVNWDKLPTMEELGIDPAEFQPEMSNRVDLNSDIRVATSSAVFQAYELAQSAKTKSNNSDKLSGKQLTELPTKNTVLSRDGEGGGHLFKVYLTAENAPAMSAASAIAFRSNVATDNELKFIDFSTFISMITAAQGVSGDGALAENAVTNDNRILNPTDATLTATEHTGIIKLGLPSGIADCSVSIDVDINADNGRHYKLNFRMTIDADGKYEHAYASFISSDEDTLGITIRFCDSGTFKSIVIGDLDTEWENLTLGVGKVLTDSATAAWSSDWWPTLESDEYPTIVNTINLITMESKLQGIISRLENLEGA